MTILEAHEWQALVAKHEARLEPFIAAQRARRGRGEKHPVLDFLFDYYGFRASHLLKWSPGIGVVCRDFEGFKELSQGENGAFIDARKFPSRRTAGLRETLEILQKTAARSPFFGCNGLHEWAMVYRQSETRHAMPLRLSAPEIADLVESQPIVCSHYDAFRFFTPEARGFNLLNPDFDTRAAFEQPGCIHANMDLYKWSAKFYPYIGSELVAAAFELALEARELDMRAAPYDLRDYGTEPIEIETAAGRAQYQVEQRDIAAKAQPIRLGLIEAYRALLDAIEEVEASP